MKRFISLLVLVMVATAAMAQGGRVVRGTVLDSDNRPIANATVSAVGAEDSVATGSDGSFTITVPTYTREVQASFEGYHSMKLEVDGSYLMFKLKVDSNYAKAKEQARIAAEQAAIANAKAAEQARIAAEKRAEAERLAAEKKAEDERIAKEKAAEQARIAAEKEAAAKVKAEEDARIAAEKRAEAERIAKEKAEIAAANKEKRDALKMEIAKHIKGYESYVNVSYNMMSNNESYAGVDYIGGYRINNNFFLGAGVGANAQIIEPPYNRLGPIVIDESVVLSHGAFYFPVYAHFRAQLLNRRCTPFLALSTGYNISLPDSFGLELTSINYNPSGVFINPQVGVTYRIKPKLSIYCAAGFNASIIPECIDNTGYSATIKQNFKYGININIGISF